MPAPLDQRIVHLLSTSDWVARRRDLVAAGISSSSIDRRLRSGLLASFGGGVVGLATAPDRRRQLFRTALLCRPAGVLSHLSAAELHGVDFERLPRRVHLTIPHGTSRAGRNVVAHQSLHLPEGDRCDLGGLAATSAARTLCDLAAGHEVRRDRLEALATWMLDRELCTIGEVAACAEALGRRGRGGARERQDLVASLTSNYEIEPSELELRFLRLAAGWGVVGLDPESRPRWYESAPGVVALTATPTRQVIELDARNAKRRAHEVRRDRLREEAARRQGWRINRFGWAEVLHRPTQLRADLQWALSATSARDAA